MLQRVAAFFLSGPDRPVSLLGDALVKTYERWRMSVFLSVTFGYTVFYTCRVNFSVAKKGMLEEGVLDASQMGIIGSALLVVYAVGRLVNGFLADRLHVGHFIASSLLASAILNLLFGTSSSFFILLPIWALNGWLQSGGSAPCVVALSHWFTSRERGTRYGIWSISHTLGEAITFGATGAIVAALGWRAGFIAPAFLAVIVAFILFWTLPDRPQTLGLPPVWQYKGELEPQREAKEPIGRLQLEVIRNVGVWVLGLASATTYVARYGMDHWGPLFLQVTKGYSEADAGMLMSIAPVTGVAGVYLSGFISDRLFGSRRQVPLLCYGLLEITALLLLRLLPPGQPWLDAVLMAAFGFGMGGMTVFLGGLMAVDIVSRRAAGAAMGIVGVFSYLGAAIQDTVSGFLLHGATTTADGRPHLPPESFDPVLFFWIAASVVSIVLASSLPLFRRTSAS